MDKSKLPKWAQKEFDLLERRLEEKDKIIDKMSGENPESAIAIRDPYISAIPVAWSWQDLIRFSLRGPVGHTDWIDVRRSQEGEIDIHADRALSIRTSASNVIHLSVVDR